MIDEFDNYFPHTPSELLTGLLESQYDWSVSKYEMTLEGFFGSSATLCGAQGTYVRLSGE